MIISNTEARNSVPTETLSQCLQKLPPEILDNILSNFSHLELSRLEQFDKGCKNFTQRRWKDLTISHRFDFDWSCCRQERYPEKTRFVLGKALETYMVHRLSLLYKATTVAKVALCFEGVMKRYPVLGAFIYSDLSSFEPFETPHKELFQRELALLKLKETNAGGDLLLQALLEATKVKPPGQQPLAERTTRLGASYLKFKKAIEANATCASMFALRLLHFRENSLNPLLLNLSQFSIWKNRDYRGLEFYLNLDNEANVASKLYAEGVFEPPVLADLSVKASLEGNLNQAEELIDSAIVSYGDQVSYRTLVNAADIKYRLKKLNESEALYYKAISLYGSGSVLGLCNLWGELAVVKYHLKKLTEAELLFDKALALGDIASWLYETAALTKYDLKKHVEAEPLFEKAFASYGNGQVPVEIMAAAALNKLCLGKREEYRLLLNKVIDACNYQRPEFVVNLMIEANKIKSMRSSSEIP